MRPLLIVVAMMFASLSAWAAGMQITTVPNPQGGQIPVVVWYPSKAAPFDFAMGPFTPHVAMGAAVEGTSLPLILISHGTGGASLTHFDTATALADAGFVVVALQHPGDNYQDISTSFSARNFSNRPRQVSAVLDFMLRDWAGHAAINPARIGMLGHSAGGATGLLLAGGVMEWQSVVAFCRANQNDWGCSKARESGLDLNGPAPVITGRDPRIKAVAIAAPALTHGFLPDGLKGITIPLQLWVGEKDEVVTDAAGPLGHFATSPDYHLVTNGGHFAYLAVCSPWMRSLAPEICFDPPGFDRAAFLLRFQQGVIGFFKASL